VHKGNLLLWGLRYQNEQINDQLSEWNLIDSAGYALSNSAQMIELKDVIRTKIKLNTNRVNGFIQNSFSFNSDKSLQLTTGIRATYWDYTKELNLSPRITLSFHPKWKQDWVFRASTGLYYQPPFYRELRNYDGTLSTNPAAQKSIHYVLAADKQFISFGGRKFKFISEMYYKQMDQIIPYEVDNVRIRYYANDKAKAYAKGIDFKVNGEFVKDLESWFSLSFMSTQEDIYNDKINIKDVSGIDSAIIYPGYIPRPTDQRFNFSVFFQDNFKNDPSFKVHLNVVFGARLPFGPPDFARYKDTLRMPPYWRADVGFSKEFVSKKNGGTAQIGPFKSLMLYGEVFNLFKRSNTISYLWIRDVNAQQYAVPNYLTSRQINIRLVGKF
jgi:outer membrane receptor protein involved in Fe transport